MNKHKRLQRTLKKFSNDKENVDQIYSGELGVPVNGIKTVDVSGRPGYVFVRLRSNTSELVQAFNSAVPSVYGLQVLLKRRQTSYEIIGRDNARYAAQGSQVPGGVYPLPRHGGQHSFNPDAGMGADVSWIYSRQFTNLLAFPSGSSSMMLTIEPHFYEWNGQWKYAQNSGTPSFAPYVPTQTGTARMALLFIDGRDNSLQIAAGPVFSGGITNPATLAGFIPDIDRDNAIPLAAVKLGTGTSSLSWSNIYDVRDFYTVPKRADGLLIMDEGTPKGTGTIFNFKGAGVTASVTGTTAFIDITSGGQNPPVTGSIVIRQDNSTLGSAHTVNVVNPLMASAISLGETSFSIDGDQIVSRAYIDGLNILYVSSGTIQVTPGTAYIPNAGGFRNFPSGTNVNLPIPLPTGVWQHVYLVDNSFGDPFIQVTGTAPDSPYSGYARVKSGGSDDCRYLGSLLPDNAGFLYRFGGQVVGNVWSQHWIAQTNAAPFLVRANVATVTTPETVSIAGLIPSSGIPNEVKVIAACTIPTGTGLGVGFGETVIGFIPSAFTAGESHFTFTNVGNASMSMFFPPSSIKITGNTIQHIENLTNATMSLRVNGISIPR